MPQHADRLQSQRTYRRLFKCICLALVPCLLVAAWIILPHASYAADSPGYLTSDTEISQRKQLAAQGTEPYQSAVNDVIAFANGKLTATPTTQEPLDIPETDSPFVDDTATAYGLALAYAVTGNISYAQKSREFIMAWVTTTKTTLHTCPNSGTCQTSLVISRVAPGFVFAADLIDASGAFSVDDDVAFRTWLRTVILPTASERINNWGDAGTFMRAAVTAYLGDQAGFDAAIVKWKSQVDLTAADGSIPEETRRGVSSLNYTQEAVDYRIGVAKIAERRGIDLWSYGRFKQSIDYVAPYVLNPGAWPWASGATSTIHPVWEIAYQHWQNPDYVPIILKRRPYGSDGKSALRWVTLTNGIPVPSLPSPTPMPTNTVVATMMSTPLSTVTTTPSQTATPSSLETATQMLSVTASTTITSTPNSTSTASVIPSPNSSPTSLMTATRISTATRTVTATRSPTQPSATRSPSVTRTPSKTRTPSVTRTATRSPSPTQKK